MRRVMCAGILSLLAVPLRAQSAPDSLLNHMTGTWVMRGTIAGKPVVHDVTAQWVLNQEYIEIHEVAREKGPNGAPGYEATVYVVRAPNKQYTVLWLDNTEASAFSPLGLGPSTTATDSISVVITTSPTDKIHTTFLYQRATNSWEWHIDNESAKGRRPFARLTLTRS